MLRVAALLSLIVWAIGWESGFLGPLVHGFLLLAVLAVLASFLPPSEPGVGARAPLEDETASGPTGSAGHAASARPRAAGPGQSRATAGDHERR